MIPLLLLFSDIGIFIIRVIAGVVIVRHGFPKIKNLKETSKNFEGMGFKPGIFWGTLVALLEFFGGIALILGFFTQIITAFFIIEFIVILIKQWQWKKKFIGGYELDLLIFGAAVLLFTIGGGTYSLDAMLGWFI